MRTYMLNRYHTRRNNWIASKGNKCFSCGSTDRLEIDHIDKSTKLYDVGKILAGGSEKIVSEEFAKCQVLCYTCHKAKSDAELEVIHGGGVSGKKNCSCGPCKSKKAEYMKAYKAARK